MLPNRLFGVDEESPGTIFTAVVLVLKGHDVGDGVNFAFSVPKTACLRQEGRLKKIRTKRRAKKTAGQENTRPDRQGVLDLPPERRAL